MPTDYFIGLMSGTSIDAIDAVLVDFGENTPKLIKTLNFPIPDSLRTELQALCQPGENESAPLPENVRGTPGIAWRYICVPIVHNS